MNVEKYLALPHRWCWGGLGGEDCSTYVCRWVEHRTGVDIACDYRGTYTTADEAEAIIASFGGMVAMFSSLLEGAGFKRVQCPADGDVGIVEAYVGFSAAGAKVDLMPAIRFGPLWGVMSARGPQAKVLDFTGYAWGIA